MGGVCEGAVEPKAYPPTVRRDAPTGWYTRLMGQPLTVTPGGWERSLAATELQVLPHDPARPFQMGIYRFGELHDRFVAPAVDHHYISFTVRGTLSVSRELGEGVERGELRVGR